MKKIIAITTAVVLFACLSTVSAHAGSARRHTIEGFMLGTGVAILSAAIINEINHDSKPYYTNHYARSDRNHHTGYANQHRDTHQHRYAHKNRHDGNFISTGPKGHWVIEKIWKQPVYKKKWNPGHYNRRGKWINGRYKKFLVKDGYWQKTKIWVRY
ncbi:hypothetical protein [Desulfobacula toluolica]|uniref:Lipoprotein n=1 Tax=Desulfobacula toluolica (strain DSM 7467 / Tol2) TaxID=651182 RepID=K0NH98_DESTT|nr:hypothetical protein [Desulfobacula toluolica]CCK79233.1 uncharacterized protein TOL2_C10680 [Desulfobacula toluolica Tol2]